MKGFSLILALSACVLSCTNPPPPDSFPSTDGQVEFLTPWEPGGGLQLFIRTDGDPHPVEENLRSFTTVAREQYAEFGIPAQALAAARFLETKDSPEDMQAIYALPTTEGIRVFRGYYVPGYGGPVDWDEVDLP